MITIMRYLHKADLYTKTTVLSGAGQKKPTWTLSQSGVRCYYVPRSAVTRAKPTYEETENVMMFFKPDSGITYNIRLYNVTDRKGNVIEVGPLEIDGILKQASPLSGGIHHLAIKAKRVVEL